MSETSKVVLSRGYVAVDTGKTLKNGSRLPRFDLVDSEGRLVWSFGGQQLDKTVVPERVAARMEEDIERIEVHGSTAFDMRAHRE